jgi:hypothetical protein
MSTVKVFEKEELMKCNSMIFSDFEGMQVRIFQKKISTGLRTLLPHFIAFYCRHQK